MATTISVRILHNKDVLLSWTLLDIFKDIYSLQDLFNDIKNGEFSHVQLSKKVCSNLLVAGCKTSTSHKLLEEINGSPFSNVVQKAKLFGMLYFTNTLEHPDDSELCRQDLSKTNLIQLYRKIIITKLTKIIY